MNHFEKQTTHSPAGNTPSNAIMQKWLLVGGILLGAGMLWFAMWTVPVLEFFTSGLGGGESWIRVALPMHVSWIANALLLGAGIQLLRRKPVGYMLAMVVIWYLLGSLAIYQLYAVFWGGGWSVFNILSQLGLELPPSLGSLTRIAIYGSNIWAFAMLSHPDLRYALDPTGTRRKAAIAAAIALLLYAVLCMVLAEIWR